MSVDSKKAWIIVAVVFLLLGGAGLVPMIALIAMTASTHSEQTAPEDVDGIPTAMLDAYQQAVDALAEHAPDCQGMTWAVLAGVGKIESNHAAGSTIAENGTITPPIIGPTLDGSGAGGNTTPHTDTDNGEWDQDTEFDAAVGPLQFIPATWATEGVSARNGEEPDPHNAYDAALTAALYLCGDEPADLSNAGDLTDALWRYNQSDVYAADVTRWIDTYSQMSEPSQAVDRSGTQDAIIAAAEDWLGTPYLWGGQCRDLATDRCDCSSLTRYAYDQGAGVDIPRTTYDQVELPQTRPDQFVRIDRIEDLRPGDMLFFGSAPPWGIGHVGLYIDDNRMLEAPRSGLNVRIAEGWQQRTTYYGAVGLR
ncbi:C40 family peptidase [Nocardiopsis tropica]|uniref:NlpC/P60 family protein n=1 Tax=Nocardiopsis tropica TaxID=109330 RepID=A0ABU7KMW4_9ACTN|nr:NlpC/P60 family protein [Nocardiopsis umidischolae]MEE2050630.1 NlpC/P60 family protein [Nocardiopsis umidischolae]